MELRLLNLFLAVAFVIAPHMTNHFYLHKSRIYLEAHKAALIFLIVGAALNLKYVAVVWPTFCVFGLYLYLKDEHDRLLSFKGLATCIPFLFSMISATWFVAGVHDLHLLGYDRFWSFYAALHGIFLGWIFVGCVAYLSRRPNSNTLFAAGCYLCLVFFLLVAFGINGTPYIKRVGVVGLSLLVPLLIGLYAFSLKKEHKHSLYLSALSLLSIVASMVLAVLNEFWLGAPRVAWGIPIMVSAHGLLNAIVTVPCFYLAILYESRGSSKDTASENDVIFFDGFCVLCSGTVALLIKLDTRGVLKYSSLQGKYAQEVLDQRCLKSGVSVVFYSGGISYERAEAIIQILSRLGGLHRWLGSLLSLPPLFLLNPLYDIVARTRYYFFGRHDTCPLPTDTDKKHFIP